MNILSALLASGLKNIRRFGQSLRRIVSWCTDNIYFDAAIEFITVYLLSNLPFLFLILSHYLNTPGIQLSWAESFNVIKENWRAGEILIFVSALLAPFCYVMYLYNRARRHMPGYWYFLIVLLFLYPASSYIFAHDRLAAIRNENFVQNSSLTLYSMALAIWYMGLVFQRRLAKPPIDDSSGRADRMAEQLSQGGA